MAPFSSSHWLVKTVRVSVLSFSAGVHVGALVDQQRDELQVIHVALADRIVAGLDVAVVGRQVERHPVALVAEVRIGAVVEQVLAERVVAVLRRHQQRAPAVAGRLVDVGAGRQQHLDRLEIVGAHRVDERRQLTAIRRLRCDCGRCRPRPPRRPGRTPAPSATAARAPPARPPRRARHHGPPPPPPPIPRPPPSALSSPRSSARPAASAAPCAATCLRGSLALPSAGPRPRGAGFERALMSAPRSMSSLTAGACAFVGGPHQRRRAAQRFLGVRGRRRCRAAPSSPSTLPVRDAIISGVRPSGSFSFGSAPASSSAPIDGRRRR